MGTLEHLIHLQNNFSHHWCEEKRPHILFLHFYSQMNSHTLKHKSLSGSYKTSSIKYVFTKLKMVAEHITVAGIEQPVSVELVLTQASSEKVMFADTWLKTYSSRCELNFVVALRAYCIAVLTPAFLYLSWYKHLPNASMACYSCPLQKKEAHGKACQ